MRRRVTVRRGRLVQLTELIRGGLERAISEVARAGAPASAVSALRLQIDRLQWRHQMELAEQRKVTGKTSQPSGTITHRVMALESCCICVVQSPLW